jgi:glutamyl-tRNA reductase
MFTVIGLNHQSADIDLRAKIAFGEHNSDALMELQQACNLSACSILSTCNRVEIYADTDDAERIGHWLSTFHNVCYRTLAPHLYQYQGEHAIEHAIRVSAGLESMVMGEPQILGQAKRAFALAKACQTSSKTFNQTSEFILRTAKKVRTDTAIGHCPVSVAFAGAKLAQSAFEDAPHKNVLLVGAGETIELMAKHLQHQGASLTFCNRTHSRSMALATQYRGCSMAFEALATKLSDFDILMSATAATTPVIDFHTVQQAQVVRDHAPLFLLDLAVPRDIAPEVTAIKGVSLHCIDDLHTQIQHNTLQRTQAALEAQVLIETAMAEHVVKQKADHAGPTITSLREHTTAMTQAELDKSLRQLRQGENPELILRQLAHNLKQKWLHQPTMNLKKASGQGRHDILECAHTLFAPSHERVNSEKT